MSLVLSLTVIGSLLSCATVVDGISARRTEYSFQSEPEGATVTVLLLRSGAFGSTIPPGMQATVQTLTTPGKATLRLEDEHAARFELAGHKSVIISLPRDFNLVAIGNLTCLVGWGVDFLTGKLWRAPDYPIRAKLEVEGPRATLKLTIPHGNQILLATIPLQKGTGLVTLGPESWKAAAARP